MQMMQQDIDVFVIADEEAFAPGAAASFKFTHIDENGAEKPVSIIVVRTMANEYVGYVNECPHKGVALDGGNGRLLSQDRKALECGQHGALFDIATGVCTDGPCLNKSLEPVAVAVIDHEVCLIGVKLLEDDGKRDPFGEQEEDGPVVLITD
ncbi:Rieske (2Fe-2S) domain protein [Methylocella silvestris BL2]|uniref:Rieske (2Fe-2S) domain protein n=2 Tax=Methylocella silvestris TaxID=199596 RepID=B8EM32_METSB|nr:Rieske (2Fe-2S) domain protein [Methylocella silvestris BL2]